MSESASWIVARVRWLCALVTLTTAATAVAGVALARATGELTYDECFGSIAGCINTGGPALSSPTSVAVSPNGHSVYVAAPDRSSGGELAHFFVGPQGSLSYDGCVSNEGFGGLCLVGGKGGDFAGPDGVAVSPNDGSVYTSDFSATLAHLFANPSQGQLSWDGCVSNDGSGGDCLDVPGNGQPLSGPLDVVVSPNGASVYALARTLSGSAGDSAISHLFANPSQGQLSWDGCVADAGSGSGCAELPGSGSPLADAQALAVSPSGDGLYVVSSDGSVSHFFATPTSGQFSWDGCVSNDGSGGTCADIPGSGMPLSFADDVAVSPDGTSLYIASAGTVSHLFVNPTGGQLTWDRCVSNDGSSGTCAAIVGAQAPLGGADEKLAISPDGKSLYVVSASTSAITIFDVGAQGELSFKGCLSDDAIPGCADPPGDSLQGASAVAVSPDGRSLYVTGATDATLVHFFRATAAGGGGGGGGGAGGSTHTVTATIGDQRVALSSFLASGCLAKTSSLTATVSANAITGSRAARLTFARADFYVDRGVRHVHGKHGATVTFTPNHTSRRQPATVTFKLAGLRTGSHTLRVKVSFHRTLVRKGHRRTVTVTASRSLGFRVC